MADKQSISSSSSSYGQSAGSLPNFLAPQWKCRMSRVGHNCVHQPSPPPFNSFIVTLVYVCIMKLLPPERHPTLPSKQTEKEDKGKKKKLTIHLLSWRKKTNGEGGRGTKLYDDGPCACVQQGGPHAGLVMVSRENSLPPLHKRLSTRC